jgi:3-oxoacyl-[acyl-carrier-protein] synthase II
MVKKRIVVTGMGIVSCFGNDVTQFYDQLLQGASGIVPIQKFDASDYPTRIAGEIRNFEVGDYMDKKQARRVDPFISYTVVAGKKALEMGGIDQAALDKLDKKRCGIIIGSGMGGMSLFYDGVETILEKTYRRLTPFFIPYIITNMGGAILAIDIGFQGPNYSISTACATSNYCIHAAAQQIQNGAADLMLCGGAEAPITPIGLAGFVAIKALSERNDEPTKACRPWDKTRDGFVMGEGAGVLMLESLEHALARGAPIYAEYLGGSINCDAFHMTSPRENGESVAECMELALLSAGVSKSQVNYINAHATSTPAGDLCEIRAIRNLFGEQTKNIKINATKSMIGHSLGAAGGLAAIATIQAIRTGKLHPTINLENLEEELEGIDAIPGTAKEHQVDVALTNSFGFGGHNSTLVFKAYQA